MPVWKGVVPAIVTPMNHGGKSVDHEALRHYCNFIIEKGTDGVFCGGTTSEGPLLSLSERREVAETVVLQAKGRIKVIIQTGCITTRESIELTRHSREIGADAAGVVFPYYYHFHDDLLFRHFMEIAEAVPGFPLFIYNIPQCTCNNLSPELFERLLDSVESIVGVKNSNPDILHTINLIQRSRGRCALFVGNDGLILAALSCGASGIVSGNASAFPEPFVNIYRAFEQGDLEKARQGQLFIDRLRGVLAYGRDVASFKKALEFRGLKAGSVRAPDRDLNEPEAETLRSSLKELDLLP